MNPMWDLLWHQHCQEGIETALWFSAVLHCQLKPNDAKKHCVALSLPLKVEYYPCKFYFVMMFKSHFLYRSCSLGVLVIRRLMPEEVHSYSYSHHEQLIYHNSSGLYQWQVFHVMKAGRIHFFYSPAHLLLPRGSARRTPLSLRRGQSFFTQRHD